MKDFLALLFISGLLLVLIILWAMALAVAEPVLEHQHSGPIAILWHSVAPITDWTPHTSTVLHGD